MMQPMATRRRADAEFLGAQHRGDHHVAPGLEPPSVRSFTRWRRRFSIST
jgi:hypothetical protein